MKAVWLALAALAFFVTAVPQADAQQRRRVVVREGIVREPCSPDLVREFFWPSCSVQRRGTPASPNVYAARTYVGQDPDPRIRAQLQREFNVGFDRW